METYQVSKTLLDKITNYLASKPFTEVNGLINQLAMEVQKQRSDKIINKKVAGEVVKGPQKQPGVQSKQ